MKTFKLKIITPKGIYKETEVEILNVRTTQGQIGILPHHSPLVAGIEISQMNYIKDGIRQYFSISKGFIYVGENETKLIVDSIESKEEIDLQRALAAKDRAKKRLEQKEGIDIARAQIALQKAIIRIQVKNIT